MISSGLFSRYARALADVAFESAQEPRVTADLATCREIFRAVPDLLEVFHSPAIARVAKQRILGELLGRYPVSPTTANFLRVLLEQNRIRYFHEILDYYTKTVNDRKGVVAARVTTAAPMSEHDLSALRAGLAAVTKRTVTLNVQTDPELLGGLVVQIGSTIYDGSVRRQLSEMRRRLAES